MIKKCHPSYGWHFLFFQTKIGWIFFIRINTIFIFMSFIVHHAYKLHIKTGNAPRNHAKCTPQSEKTAYIQYAPNSRKHKKSPVPQRTFFTTHTKPLHQQQVISAHQ
ncbi:hypothetical protein CLJ10_11665 [Listeria monocytogenes]|nr:hypothetical protein [Listeria monocytogenes]EAE8291685.1 hypothetical protein [Listeria monocytogenes]EAE8298243.1 hypothetical protein [Listeria monocytogenes]EAF1426899.1 hypothetical protein [Listeria monocytogenes]EAF2156797.1 hypothetical protein [Listeria monocytogenes]